MQAISAEQVSANHEEDSDGLMPILKQEETTTVQFLIGSLIISIQVASEKNYQSVC